MVAALAVAVDALVLLFLLHVNLVARQGRRQRRHPRHAPPRVFRGFQGKARACVRCPAIPPVALGCKFFVFRVNWAGNRGGRRWWVWLVKVTLFFFSSGGGGGRGGGTQSKHPWTTRERERERRRTRGAFPRRSSYFGCICTVTHSIPSNIPHRTVISHCPSPINQPVLRNFSLFSIPNNQQMQIIMCLFFFC